MKKSKTILFSIVLLAICVLPGIAFFVGGTREESFASSSSASSTGYQTRAYTDAEAESAANEGGSWKELGILLGAGVGISVVCMVLPEPERRLDCN